MMKSFSYTRNPTFWCQKLFIDIRLLHFLISGNRNFWWQKYISDIRKSFSAIKIRWCFYDISRPFLISEEHFLTSEIRDGLLILENHFFKTRNCIQAPEEIPQFNPEIAHNLVSVSPPEPWTQAYSDIRTTGFYFSRLARALIDDFY